jgi:crotonobetainyl-CoA:carnitine CoA-transferase CaiB-like acyl-CoA transferase
MNAVLTTKTTNDWVEVLEAAGVPCGPVYDYAQMFADPRACAYESNPELGEVRASAPQISIGEGGGCANVAPKLGQHNAEIFGRLGLSKAEMNESRAYSPARLSNCPAAVICGTIEACRQNGLEPVAAHARS